MKKRPSELLGGGAGLPSVHEGETPANTTHKGRLLDTQHTIGRGLPGRKKHPRPVGSWYGFGLCLQDELFLRCCDRSRDRHDRKREKGRNSTPLGGSPSSSTCTYLSDEYGVFSLAPPVHLTVLYVPSGPTNIREVQHKVRAL